VPRSHPLCFLSQSPAADELRRNADVLLVVGSRLGNLDVPFDKYWGAPAEREVIQIDVDPRHIGVSRPVTLGIVAEARTTLDGLLGKLRDRAVASRERTDLLPLRAGHAAWMRALQESVASWSGAGIHPAQALAAVGEVFGGDAIYCTDGGMTSLWAAMVLPSTRPSSYHSILELGMLGTGIPSAIGARLGARDREVRAHQHGGQPGRAAGNRGALLRSLLRARHMRTLRGKQVLITGAAFASPDAPGDDQRLPQERLPTAARSEHAAGAEDREPEQQEMEQGLLQPATHRVTCATIRAAADAVPPVRGFGSPR
jgi:hypothetical protein